eukprot:m.57128 g.57128  ORF g.57128 m.57128 type:complete len:179 (-) comp7822_c0_seq1:82-618(-)
MDGLSINVLEKVVHRVVDGVCGGSLPSVSEIDIGWSLGEWGSTIYKLFNSIKSNALSDQDHTNLKKALALNLSCNEDTLNSICSIVDARINDLKKAILSESCAIGEFRLLSFDWDVKLVVSGSNMNSMSKTLLVLTFQMETTDGTIKDVCVEMNKDEVGDFVASLSSAQKSVEELASS